MISKRLIANLIVFFVVSAVLVGYGVVTLLGNPLRSPTVLTTDFPDASGLFQNFTVELNGVPVGSVAGIRLTQRGTEVTMDIHPGTRVPGDARASIAIANDLGEQVVDLVPAHGGTAPALQSGDRVPVAPNQIPANVGQVVEAATTLLRAIPAGDLNKLLGELAVSLKGEAANLRTIISAGTTFSQEFVAYQKQFSAVLANAPPTLDAVTSVAPQLQQALANTAALLQVLAQQKSGLDTVFTQGGTAASEVNQLVTTQRANLGCVFHDAAGVLSNIAQPVNLTNLSQSLAGNESFFGAIDHVAAAGLAKTTTRSQADNPDQLFLRTRLLVPPVLSPSATTYTTANQIPQILPGAGCVTVDGDGVPAATQAGFAPADGGKVVPPTAAEADIATGTTSLPTTSAAFTAPAQSQWALAGVGGLVVPLLILAWGARPSRRRTRRRASERR
jgi:virulence factor Mce-like protein